ncbi:hypothetical protein FACS189428_3090 [Clostridia bacterium]|nr:hypothetical protein FACS189428_3090 [Clostridia bacterium]
MKYKLLVFILLCAGFTACYVDYEMRDSFVPESDYLVINSLLSPRKPIRIDFYQITKADSGYVYTSLKGVHVLLKEDSQVLYNAVCEDSVLKLPHYPKAGCSYALEAYIKEGEIATASTLVPVPATCNASIHFGDAGYYRSDDYMYFSDFHIDTKTQASLWITACDVFDTGDTGQCDEIYTNHPLVDKFNREEGGYVLNPQVGSLIHSLFLRVKNKHLDLFDHLYMMPTRTNLVDVGDNEDKKPVQYQVKLIVASKECDQYGKSLYEQKSMFIYEDDISAIVYQPMQVYSNIKGGLGIFAGMNETDYFFDIPAYDPGF